MRQSPDGAQKRSRESGLEERRSRSDPDKQICCAETHRCTLDVLIPATKLTGLGQADMLWPGSTPRPSRQHATPLQQPCLLSADYNESAFTFCLIPTSRHSKQEKDRKPIPGWNRGRKEPLSGAVWDPTCSDQTTKMAPLPFSCWWASGVCRPLSQLHLPLASVQTNRISCFLNTFTT